MSTFVVDSDDDDDMFIRNKGSAGTMSFYSAGATNDDDDDDDLDDDDEALVVPKKKRGPRSRMNNGLRPKRKEDVVDVDAVEEQETKEKPSVFSADDEDDVCIIIDDDDDDNMVANVAAIAERSAQQALQEAQAHLSKGNEEEIERDAQLYAQRMVAENMRKENHLKEMEALDKQRAAKSRGISVGTGTSTVAKTQPSGVAALSTGEGTPITLRVRAGENSIKMKILTSDALLKMLGPFCKRFDIDPAKAVMEVDGEEVDEADTSVTYDLEDHNIVEIRVRK